MRIALIAPPFIKIPPRFYGGTELFIANLADCSDVESTDVNQFRQLCKIIMSTAKHHVVLKLSI